MFVPTPQLIAGQVVAADVVSRQGQRLVTAGTQLSERHLGILRTWGVAGVHVADPSDAAVIARPIQPEEVEEAQRIEGPRFIHCDLANPVMKALHLCAVRRHINRRRRQGGKTPTPAGPVPAVISPPPVAAVDPLILVQRLPRLEALPESYRQLQTVADSPHASAEDVAEVLSRDQGLASRCLRLANSPMYGFPSRIDTLTRATAVIGTRQICQLALAGSVMELFRGVGEREMRRLWRHGIACALAAHQIAQHLREANSERHFIAGLLHDIGHAVMLALGERVDLGWEPRQGSAVWRLQRERDRWGTDHVMVGACLLRRWNLPICLVDAVERHHGDPCGCHPVDCAVVAAAEVIASALRVDAPDRARPVEPLSAEVWKLAGVEPQTVPGMAEVLERQFEEVAAALGQEDGHA